jgi:hypothetical protein
MIEKSNETFLTIIHEPTNYCYHYRGTITAKKIPLKYYMCRFNYKPTNFISRIRVHPRVEKFE